MVPERQAARAAWIGWLTVALVLAAAWLLTPALTATHIEGFSASLQVDAIAMHRHLVDRADLLYPIQTEYLSATRSGVVLLLRGLMALSGEDGDGLFKLLTVASLVLLLASSAFVARRHARLGWRATLAGMVLLPGVFELGFAFNDNVVAAAFGTLALALLPSGTSDGITSAWVLRSLSAGCAIAIGALCRIDALIMLPLALGLAWIDQARWKRFTLLCLIAALAMLMTFAIAQWLSGVSLLDALKVGRFFDAVHANGRNRFVRWLVCTLFFGLPGLLFIALGAGQILRRDTTRRRIGLVLLPLLVALYALNKATETRMLYPYVTAFAILLCGRGLRWSALAIADVEMSRRRRSLAAAGLAMTLLVWALPPLIVPVKDGPRPVVGRLWSPPLWRAWQARVDASLDDVDAIVGKAGSQPRLAVVSAHFNSDHYLQLRAWQNGWTPQRDGEAAPSCPGGLDVWKKGDHTLMVIRLDNTYGLSQMDQPRYTAVHLNETLGCQAIAGVPTLVTDFSPSLTNGPVTSVFWEHMPAEPPTEEFYTRPVAAMPLAARLWGLHDRVVPLSYGVNRTGPLDASQLARIRDLVARELVLARERDGKPLPSMASILPRFHTLSWRMPISPPPTGEGVAP